MEKKTETALDIIYDMPSKIEKLEKAHKMLDNKLNSILVLLKKLELQADNKVLKTEVDVNAEEEVADEVMEIRAPSFIPPALKAKLEEVRPEPIVSTPEPTINIKPVEVDPLQDSGPKQSIVLVKGKYRGKDGLGIAGIEVKISNEAGALVKKTKTTALGDWLVVLQPGNYIGEFAKTGISPLVKPITILPGKKEIEVII